MLYLIALLIIVFILAGLCWKFHRDGLLHQGEATWWLTAYTQLDKGFAEVTDAYATDMAQWEEDGNKLLEEIGTLHASLARKASRIAAIVRENTSIQRRNDEQAQSIDGLRRQLDIAQKIISDHDLNCLPHIVLKGMEDPELKAGTIPAGISIWNDAQSPE